MRYLRNILISVLVFSVVCGSQVLGATYVSAATPTDVVDSPYKEAVEVLGALGLMTGDADTGLFRPDDTITRKEFAVVICNLLGLGEQAQSEMETPFSDVAPDDAMSGSIKLAYGQGVIKGFSDGTFQPESPVTYEQALKMIVSALGFDIYAAQKGGYPVGYLAVAGEKKITKNVDAKLEASVTRGTVAQLIYNSLDVDFMKQIGFGSNLDYDIEKDKNVLTEYLNIETDTKQITATGDTALNGSSSLKQDEVKIGDTTYKIGKTDARDLLGQQVVYYAKIDKEKDERTLLYVKPDESKERVVVAPADNIDRSSTTVAKFVYWVDKEQDKDAEELTISPRVNVIYNRAAIDSFTQADLTPDQGSVKLISSSDNDMYDIIIVTANVNYVVQNVAEISPETVIYDKYGNPPLSVELNSTDQKVHVVKNGKNAKITDAKEWDVVTVAQSKDQKVVNMNIVSKKVTGTVSEISSGSEDGKPKAVIGDKEYKVADNYTNASNAKQLEVNDKGTFYLDADGMIAAFDSTASSSDRKVGYLLKMAVKDGVDGRLQFRIADPQGKWNQCTGADKISINGENKTSEEIVSSRIFLDPSTQALLPQMIAYKLNAAGEVSAIDVYQEGDNRDNFIKPATAEGAMKYMSNAHTFGNFIISDNVQIITLPASFDVDNEDAYRATKMSDFVHNNDYKIRPYYTSSNSEKLMICDVILYDKGGSSSGLEQVSVEDAIAVVDSITQAIDEKGDHRDKVNLYCNGQKIAVYSLAGKKANGIKTGDVILFKKTDNTLTGYLKIFNAAQSMLFDFTDGSNTFEGQAINDENTKKFWDVGILDSGTDISKYMIPSNLFSDTNLYKYTGDNRTAYDAVYFAKVVYRDGNYIRFQKVNNSSFVRVVALPSSIYVYDKVKNKVNTVSNAEIQEGSVILIKTRNSAVQDILLVKDNS